MPPAAPVAEQEFDPAAYLEDLPDEASAAEAERTLNRRQFVVPRRSVTVDGEHLERLDPADPDERALLIRGEHPELNDTFESTLDGPNPRMHLTMHEVIANQLWADDPPEAWQAAQRLRDQGMERHAILHELLAVMIEHMHPVLAERREFDTAAYRRALDSLG